jgi:carboxypeptidase T
MKLLIGVRAMLLSPIRMAVALCTLIFILFASVSRGSYLPDQFHARVHLSDFGSDLNRLSYLGYDIAGFNESSSTAHLIVTSEEYSRLVDMGYKTQILPEPAPFKRSPGTRAKAAPGAPAANIVIDDGYHHFRQVDSILEQFQAAFPDIALMVDVGSTHYGRTIWALKISDNVVFDEDEPAIMFNGLHHARELITTEVVLDTIQYLTTMYGVDPDVTRWVDTWEIWLIPVVNPDGNDIVFTKDPNWRKNARDNNLNGVIDNDDGVDLNRNYPFKWGLTPGSSGVPSSGTYRGPAPASEPETQAIIALSLKERFVFSIAYHSYGGVVLFPYGSAAAVNPIPNISRSVCADFADVCVREDGKRYDLRPRLYDVNGLDRDWHYHNGTIGFVVELGVHGFQPDYDVWRDAIVEGVRPGWQYLLNRIDGSSIFGHVRDEQSELPIAAAIDIDEIRFFEGEIRTSDPDTGRYHWIVDPGTYNLNLSASGYVAQSFRATVEDGTAFSLELALQPEVASISDAEEGEITEQEDKPPAFALLQNYPNPVNPGTWLPFRLSEPADVTICIHDLRGVLVRRLRLGYREAGSYVSRNRAVFWDGKDETGDDASSGVYFYSIKAGKFTAARKIVKGQ